VRRAGRIETVALEDYVLGSVLAEVSPILEPSSAVRRIFEVQAVLARSYVTAGLGRHRAEGFDVCDSSHCQLYDPARLRTSRFASVAREAVRDTNGVVLTYGGRPATAIFHADCGGRTAAADSVWGGRPVPYLQSTTDGLRTAEHRGWDVTLEVDALREILNADARSRLGARLRGLEVRRRDVSGRAIEIELLGAQPRIVRGEEFRAILNRRLGERAVQSTRFSIRQTAAAYVLHGTGFGHGVGLCQIGAAARARRGESLEQILTAYYGGTAVQRL
jgi:stage II sporulation protein D